MDTITTLENKKYKDNAVRSITALQAVRTSRSGYYRVHLIKKLVCFPRLATPHPVAFSFMSNINVLGMIEPSMLQFIGFWLLF